jgi:hypothetical protein
LDLEEDASTILRQSQAFAAGFVVMIKEGPLYRSLWLSVLEREDTQLLIAVVPGAELYPAYTPLSLCLRENSLAAGQPSEEQGIVE